MDSTLAPHVPTFSNFRADVLRMGSAHVVIAALLHAQQLSFAALL